jgi:transposase
MNEGEGALLHSDRFEESAVIYLGIDLAKRKFECALLLGERYRNKVFDNNVEGIGQCLQWLQGFAQEPVHACLEATGPYGESLAGALFEAGHRVSLVNPARVREFAKGLGLRNKTDRLDARVLARFAKDSQPHLWTPPPAAVRELSALVRRLDALMQMHTQESNRRQVAHPSLQQGIDEHLAFLDARIVELREAIARLIDKDPELRAQRELLETIPGIAQATSAWLLAELRPKQFSCAREAAAHTGLAPIHCLSGESVRGRPKLPRDGNARLRKVLYWPAISAMRFNPLVRDLAQRLAARGKHKMAIIVAAMRKLLHIAYGVLKSGKKFDPTPVGS